MSDLLRQRNLTRRIARTEVIERPMMTGAAFPSSPATGLLFFRTDLGFLAYYDGAHWLSAHEYEADLTPYVAGSTVRLAATNNTVLIQPRRTDYSAGLTRIKLYADVLTTNNGTNYWSFAIGTDTTTAWSPDTSADAANTGLNKETAPGTVITGNFWKAGVTKVGAPGTLAFNVSVFYRLVLA